MPVALAASGTTFASTTTTTTTDTVSTTSTSSTTTSTTTTTPVLTTVATVTDEDIPFIWVSCGSDYTMGVTTVNTLVVWGDPMSEIGKVDPPEGLLWIKAFSGYSHSCGIDELGFTRCWGRNLEGQCDVPEDYTFEYLELGEAHTCGLTNNDLLLCWGADTLDRLVVPTNVARWTGLSVGAYHTCGLTSGGLIKCWGEDGHNRLNVPYTTELGIYWQAVTCGNRHCCGMLTDHSVAELGLEEHENVKCWGNNWVNQLQIPGQSDGRYNASEKFVSIRAGFEHTCGLTAAGTTWCWGGVEYYGLVTDIPDVTLVFIAAGGYHSCGIDGNQLAYCWGDNSAVQSEVPIDDRTIPPSILEYSNDPEDIYVYEDPYNRVTKYDANDVQFPELHTFQHIHMAIFLPEFADPGSLRLVFTRYEGTEDPYSPHRIAFATPEYDYPGVHLVNISAFDLTKYHDTRWGPNPNVRFVTSTYVNGETHHTLVDGGIYRVDATYADALGHSPANHTLARLRVEYDLVTEPPILRSPSSGLTNQALTISYELLEDMEEDSVWVTFTFDGQSALDGYRVPGSSLEDDYAPHEIQLAGTSKGNHSFELNLVDPETTFNGTTNTDVVRTFQNSMVSDYRSLLSGGTYTMQFRCRDIFVNSEEEVIVPEIEYFQDIYTEPLFVFQPSVAIFNPLIFSYIIPEPAYITSFRVIMTWLRLDASQPLAVEDKQSPHTFWVKEHAEQEEVEITLTFGTSNLFQHIRYDNLPQPDVRAFTSTGTPVRSYLQPWSQYNVEISYQDRFQNPRAYTRLNLWTNFTEPSTPDVPTLIESTTASLNVGWLRNETGGVQISHYDLQLEELAKVTTEPLAAWQLELVSKNLTLTGQASNDTVIIGLKSSTYYSVRVRACNMLGCSGWTDWATFRTRSVCGDGIKLDGEQCDDGGLLDTDGCAADCTIETGWVCSELLVEDPSICSASGMDGLRIGEEECDDCNNVEGDGCSPEGTVEPFYECIYQGRLGIDVKCKGVTVAWTTTADLCMIACGDGLKHYTEECDDGNLIDGDGCSSNCLLEIGYTCEYLYPLIYFSICSADCGDGLIRAEEECDDGNNYDGDGCAGNCTVEDGWTCLRINVNTTITTNDSSTVDLPEGEEFCQETCSNGIIDDGETCDDADLVDGDGCSDCQIDAGWTCEIITARVTDTSAASFCTPHCGDGYRIQVGALAEECDDGNNMDFDGCSSDCRVESGYACTVQIDAPDVCSDVCGNGITTAGEECDDGNLETSDGCDTTCKTEPGYVCSASTAEQLGLCVYLCGDGVVSLPNETCDDGNTVANDGCSELCQVEEGWHCGAGAESSASVCSPLCGDGIVRSPEACDDGGVSSDDGCDTACAVEEGWVCVGNNPSTCEFQCGDGIRQEGEDCDDGNLFQNDGCDTQCMVEARYVCESWILGVDISTSVCTPICGDGLPAGDEECDDGNLETGDGCDASCKVETHWTCCETVGGGSSVCTHQAILTTGCSESLCGNSFRDEGEECDDGNRETGDGCSYFCNVEPGYVCSIYMEGLADECQPICRDGLLVTGEACDDGNAVNGDGCDSTCEVEPGWSCIKAGSASRCSPICGDGYRVLDEECDDFNTASLDGCSNDCRIERGFTCHGGSPTTSDICYPTCGDGLRIDSSYSGNIPDHFLEECDVGSEYIDEGCDPTTCLLNQGFTCSVPVDGSHETCWAICGDGLWKAPFEGCDDGNTVSGDGCSSSCTVEDSYECSLSSTSSSSVCTPSCGDGRVSSSEECDDGNVFDRDGCSSNCSIEEGFECLGGTLASASVCSPRCGDGFEVFGEECDDGNRVSGDGCSITCTVEEMYFCSRGAHPLDNLTDWVGPYESRCERTCGNGMTENEEECDDGVVEDPNSILTYWQQGRSTDNSNISYQPFCISCRAALGQVCGDGRRSLTSEALEECDDGNLVAGDGCSPTCTIEPGWVCNMTPHYVEPPTGDSCSPVCGDGIYISSHEECDDGNEARSDGCSGDCRIEAFWHCFHNLTSDTSGVSGSMCVETVPPRLLHASFDGTYARVLLNFSRWVPRFGLSETHPQEFDCSALFASYTVDMLGTDAICRWSSHTEATILLGRDATLVSFATLTVLGGVLHSAPYSTDYASTHEVYVDGSNLEVLRPVAVVMGPEVVSTCVTTVFLESRYSRGHQGRTLTVLWRLVEAVDVTTHVMNETETARVDTAVKTQDTNSEIVFVKQGTAYNTIDLDLDRSLRAGFIYKINLTVTNTIGLSHSVLHHLYVIEEPLPMLTPTTDRLHTLLSEPTWFTLSVEAEIPPECSTEGAAILMYWSHEPQGTDAGTALDLTSYVASPPIRMSIYSSDFDYGFHYVRATGCALLTIPRWNITKQGWSNYTDTICGQTTFALDIFDGSLEVSNSRRLGSDPSDRSEDQQPSSFRLDSTALPAQDRDESRRLQITTPTTATETLTTSTSSTTTMTATTTTATTTTSTTAVDLNEAVEAAVAGSTMQLVVFAQDGNYILGQPDAEDTLLNLVSTIESPGDNDAFMTQILQAWPGGLDANRTMIFGVILLPSSSASATDKAALSWVRPRVTWSLTAENKVLSNLTSSPALGVPTWGGPFLTVPSNQFIFGSRVTVQADIVLHQLGDVIPGICEPGLKNLTLTSTLAVNQPPASGYLEVSTTRPGSGVAIATLTQTQWTDSNFPLQYRFEAEDVSTGISVPLSDWSYKPELEVFFLVRSTSTKNYRGFVRDSTGSMSEATPVLASLSATSSTADQQMLILSEYTEGNADLSIYRSDLAVYLLEKAVGIAEQSGPPAMMQVLEDTVAAALTEAATNEPPANCSTDCSQWGRCPDPEIILVSSADLNDTGNDSTTTQTVTTTMIETTVQNWTQCVCTSPATGLRCEQHPTELETQTALTGAAMLSFLSIIEGTDSRMALTVTAEQETLGRLLSTLLRIIDDCRRVTTNVLEAAAQVMQTLVAASSKGAIRQAVEIAVALLSRISDCLPTGDAYLDPAADMPAPSEVLAYLGATSACSTAAGTETKVCYDLATSIVNVSCPRNSTTSRSSVVRTDSSTSVLTGTLLCTVDLQLGLSFPYPCACPIPVDADISLGLGRSVSAADLSDMMNLRSEYNILWRFVASSIYNSTAQTSSDSTASDAAMSVVPDEATGVWLSNVLSDRATFMGDTPEETELRRQRRSIVQAMRQASEYLGDAVTLGMVPGQEALSSEASAMSFFSEVAFVSVVSANSSGSSVNVSEVVMDLGEKASVELQYNRSSLAEELTLVSTGNEDWSGPPLYIPLTGVLWHDNGGPFGWLDSSRELLSSVAALRLPTAVEDDENDVLNQFTRLRFRFQIPLLDGVTSCGAGVTQELATLCCNSQQSSSAEDEECPSPAPTPTPTPAPTPAPTPVAPTPSPAGTLFRMGGTKMPFDGPVQLLYDHINMWIPFELNATLAGQDLHIRGGDLRLGHICRNASRNSSNIGGLPTVTLLAGALMEEPTYDGALCSAIFQALSSVSAPTVPTWSLSQLLLDASTLAGVWPESHYQPPNYLENAGDAGAAYCATGNVTAEAWCNSNFDEETDPVEAEVSISDTGGLILLGVSGVQLSFGGSSELSLKTLNEAPATVYAATSAVTALTQMRSMYLTGVEAMETAGTVSNDEDLFRVYRHTTTKTSTTITRTTSTTTTSTSSTPYPVLAPWAEPPGVMLRLLESTFDAYLDLLGDAVNGTLDEDPDETLGEFEVFSRRADSLRPFSDRAADAATAFEAWFAGLSDDFLNVSEDDFNDSNDSNDSDIVGEEQEEVVEDNSDLDVACSVLTLNSATTCSALRDCSTSFDAAEELECVAWSASVMRWVPALGCRIVSASELGEAIVLDGTVEVVCECESGILHNAVAIASKLPAMKASEGRVRIVNREVFVVWTTKLNKYNVRGVYFFTVLLILSILHVACTCRQENHWRKRARWVVARSDRDRENAVGVTQMNEIARKLKHNRVEELRSMQPRAAPEDLLMEGHVEGVPIGSSPTADQPAMLALTAQAHHGQPLALTAEAADDTSALALAVPGSIGGSQLALAVPQVASTTTADSLDLVSQALAHVPRPSYNIGELAGYMSNTGADGLRRINDAVNTWIPHRPGARTLQTQNALVPISRGSSRAIVHFEDSASQSSPSSMPLALRSAGIGDAPGIPERDAMITSKAPRAIPLSRRERLRLAIRRARSENVWRACLIHHKLFSLLLDSQSFIYAAPERVAILHLSLWVNACVLGLLLTQWTKHRPGEDPHCTQLGMVTWGCLVQWLPVLLAFVSALITLLISNVLMILSRGRSFPARTRHMIHSEKERAFVHHMMGKYPMCWHEPRQVITSARNFWLRWVRRQPVSLMAHNHDHTLLWQPSWACIFSVVSVPLITFALLYSMFFFSSSIIMEDITYSDREGYKERVYPEFERAEVEAAAQDVWLRPRRVMVPLFQRYLVLLVLAWCFHLLLLEPLLLQFHLFLGEPTLDAVFGLWGRLLNELARRRRKDDMPFADGPPPVPPMRRRIPEEADNDDDDDGDDVSTDDDDEEESTGVGQPPLPGQPTVTIAH